MYNVIVIKCHQYTFWLNYNDLTVLPHWNDGVCRGNYPKIAQLFR
jgi:hypothetical protein